MSKLTEKEVPNKQKTDILKWPSSRSSGDNNLANGKTKFEVFIVACKIWRLDSVETV